MKFAVATFPVALISFLIAASSHAEVLPEGTFIAAECGNSVAPESAPGAATPTSKIQAVCAGTVSLAPQDLHSGSEHRALQFRMSDGSVTTLRVQSLSALLIELAGERSKLILHLASSDGTRMAIAHEIVDKFGNVLSIDGHFGPLPFSVPQTQAMFIIE